MNSKKELRKKYGHIVFMFKTYCWGEFSYTAITLSNQEIEFRATVGEYGNSIKLDLQPQMTLEDLIDQFTTEFEFTCEEGVFELKDHEIQRKK